MLKGPLQLLNACGSCGAQRQEILRPAYWFADFTQQFLQVLIAIHEINFTGVHDEQVAGGVVKEEMLVRLVELAEIFVTRLE